MSALKLVPGAAFDNTITAPDDYGQTTAELDPVNVGDKNFEFDNTQISEIIGMTVAYAQTSRPAHDVYEAYDAPPVEVLWSNFNFEQIPDNTDIQSVKVTLLTADFLMGDPDEAEITYEWKLLSTSDVILQEGSIGHVDCLDREIFVDVEDLTTSDFNFRNKGGLYTTKLAGGVFNKSDLVGAKIKYTITNLTPYSDSFLNMVLSLIDVVNVDVVYTVIKPYINGYVDRKAHPFIAPNGQPICRSFVINKGPNYDDGSPLDGIMWAYIMDPVTQEAAVADIDAELKFASDNGYKAKLRVFNPPPASLNASAPAVSHNGSGALPTGNCATGQQFTTTGFTIPNVRFWHDADYIAAYGALQTFLANKYDSHPALADVAFMGGCLDFAEPMIRHISGTGTEGCDHKRAQINTWQAAGSPNTNWVNSDKIALKALMDKHLVWKTTPQSLACNPYQTITLGTCGTSPVYPKYSGDNDNTITLELAQYWCDILGKRAIIGNNSIRPISTIPEYDTMYTSLVGICAATGADMYFQTAGDSPIDASAGTFDEALDATIARCKGYGAIYIELPDGYKTKPGVTIPPF